MIQWRDEGILISQRRHGESAAIIDVFTPSQGRVAGVVRGGGGRRMAPVLQLGAQLDLRWSARLEEHLGHFTVELTRSRAALAMSGRLPLAGVAAVCALLRFVLPEREGHPALYAQTGPLLDLLGQDDLWPLAYLRWEVLLLRELGFGLDLDSCAVSGAREDLAYISPKSGRAVSRAAAGEWAARLLPLSPALTGASTEDDDIRSALRVTGHFLTHQIAPSLGDHPLPAARQRLMDLI